IKSLTYSCRSDYNFRSNDTTPIEIQDIEVQEETEILTNALAIGVTHVSIVMVYYHIKARKNLYSLPPPPPTPSTTTVCIADSFDCDIRFTLMEDTKL
uniref:Uncharacterized protein n=1 Tax=Amphimedon queenslandica TaxID=400682 RepID=A0A1X7V620_AMPQE